MIGDELCRHCAHPKSAHTVGLFGPQCSGKFWVQLDDEGADKPCQCGGFVE